MKSKICPRRVVCRSKGTCETCDFERVFRRLTDKNKKFKTKNKALQEENEKLKDRIETLMNPDF